MYGQNVNIIEFFTLMIILRSKTNKKKEYINLYFSFIKVRLFDS